MAFKFFSLKGFKSNYEVRRRIESLEGGYLCSATLYKGKHLRRQMDEVSSVVSYYAGLNEAHMATHDLRDILAERHGLARLSRSHS